MTAWRDTTLGELITVKHGYAFKGSFFAKEGKELVLTPGNFPVGGGLQFRQGKERYYTGPYPPEFKLSPGQLLMVMTDLKQDAPILGSPAFVPDQPPVLHNQRLGLVRVKPGVDLDPHFLYYLLLSDQSRSQLRATATGATVRHTAPERIYRVQVKVPPFPIQQTIGTILNTVDSLIDNNRRRINLLEKMAKAIYREWFISFRFPGHQEARFVESSLGTIPDTWNIKTLVSIASLTMGQSPPSEYYNSEGIGKPFHQGVTDFGNHYPIHRKYCSIEARSASRNDILISVRAPVGRLNITLDDITIGRGLAAARSLTRRQSVLFRALQDVVFAEEDSLGGGTIFNAVGKKELGGVPIVVADEEVEAMAETIFAGHEATIRSLTFASRHLRSIRDLLLPKLITGQVDATGLDSHSTMEPVV